MTYATLIAARLGKGAQVVDEAGLDSLPTPPATKTWTPVPHETVVSLTMRSLTDRQLVPVQAVHSVRGKHSAQYLGVMLLDVRGGLPTPPACDLVVAVRNSHDKSLAAAVGFGIRMRSGAVGFMGSFALARRHTRHIMRELPKLVAETVTRVSIEWGKTAKLLRDYQDWTLTNVMAHHIVVAAFLDKIIPLGAVPRILAEWHDPSDPAYEERNGWSLLNAFLLVLGQRYAVGDLMHRSERFHNLLTALMEEYKL